MDIRTVLKRFPKERPELPGAYKAIYDEFYFRNREGQYATTSLSQKLESWLHYQVAKDVKKDGPKTTLEIGAGTLNQLQYEPRGARYDIVEPYKKLFEHSPLAARVTTVYNDINEVPSKMRYERITSVATFEHILNLPEVVARSALLLAPGGTLRTSIPNEGRFPWYLGTLVTGTEFRMRFHLEYQVMMHHEHVNTADEIEEILGYFFAENRCAVFGVSKGLSLYRFYESSKPNLASARAYLSSLL